MKKPMHDNPTNEESGWTPCPADEIGGMVRRMKARRQKVFVAQLAGGAVFGILLGLAFFTFNGPQDPNFGGITCADVAQHTDAYLAGRLDPELKQQIDAHLAACPACGLRFRRMIEDRKARRAGKTANSTDERRNVAATPILASAHEFSEHE